MRFAQILESLSLPALALAAELTLACADGAPTAPEPAASFASGSGPRAPIVDDDGNLGCRRGYKLVYSGFDSPYDLNQNLHVCVIDKDGGKQLHIDDDGRLGCPRGYTLIQTSNGSWGDEVDFNGNDYICQLTP